MWVLLQFGPFCPLFFKFTAGLKKIRVLLEGESYLRIYTHVGDGLPKPLELQQSWEYTFLRVFTYKNTK